MSARPFAAVVAIAVVAAFGSLGSGACKGANSPSGECLNFSCDADGAKAMLHQTVDAAYTPSERAKKALDAVIEAAVAKMEKEQAFTPEQFELARSNLKKFLDEIPEGGEDPLGPAAEELQKKSAKGCPMWPFC